MVLTVDPVLDEHESTDGESHDEDEDQQRSERNHVSLLHRTPKGHRAPKNPAPVERAGATLVQSIGSNGDIRGASSR